MTEEITTDSPKILNCLSKLGAALAKAQSEIKAPVKNRHVDFTPKTGGRVKYSYADLADVIEAVKAPLSKNELAIIHQLDYHLNHYGLKTTLLHSSGEQVSTWYPLPDPMKSNIRAQEFGSALTYARRYSLSSLVGIASEEDDDGNAAGETEPPKKPANVSKPTQKNDNPRTQQSSPQPKGMRMSGTNKATQKVSEAIAKAMRTPQGPSYDDHLDELIGDNPADAFDHPPESFQDDSDFDDTPQPYKIGLAGPYKGKTLEQIPLVQLRAYLDHVIKNMTGKVPKTEDEKALWNIAQLFIDNAKYFLATKAK